jgi:putative membrane protein
MCDYTFFPNPFFSLLVCGLIILALGYLILKFVKLFNSRLHHHEGHARDRDDSLEIIKMRFAKGQLSSEEYVRMRNILFHA